MVRGRHEARGKHGTSTRLVRNQYEGGTVVVAVRWVRREYRDGMERCMMAWGLCEGGTMVVRGWYEGDTRARRGWHRVARDQA